MTKKIIIPYFPKGMKFSTPLLFGATLALIYYGHPVWGVLLALLGGIIITTNYVTEIDLDNRRYYDYISMFGISLSRETEKFQTLDKIVVTKGNYSQTISTRVQSRQMDWSDFTATLILDGGNKTLDLITRNSKKELITGLRDFAAFLNVGVEDRTTLSPYWIDLSKVHAE